MPALIVALLLSLPLAGCDRPGADGQHWQMHTIDDRLSGADGVDLADIDGDGDADAVVGWEESAAIMLYENPGPGRAREAWAGTAIGGGLAVGKIEDARFADLDGDGRIDAVLSATEKRSERIGIHWLVDRDRVHEEAGWRGTWLDRSLPYLYLKVASGQIDGAGAPDIVAGSKAEGRDGALVWYQAPAAPGPQNAGQWRGHVIDQVEWTDSLAITDINGDGRNDLLMNYWNHLAWYENLAGEDLPHWRKHLISDSTKAYLADCSGKPGGGRGELLVAGADISAADAGDVVLYLVGKEFAADGSWHGRWRQREIRSATAVPRDAGSDDYQVKGIACGNIDGDGRMDIVVSVSGRGHGVFALMNLDPVLEDQSLQLAVIAGRQFNSRKGIKHDNLVLADLDGDGDLDVVTTEENGAGGLAGRLLPGLVTRGLGLVWFENPGTTAAPRASVARPSTGLLLSRP